MAPCCRCAQPQFLPKPRKTLVLKSLKPLKKPKAILNKIASCIAKIGPKALTDAIGNCLAVIINHWVKPSLGYALEDYFKHLEQVKIYAKLMENPAFHSRTDSVDLDSFIHDNEKEQCSRLYASYLWNWKLQNEADKIGKLLDFIHKSIFLAVKYMEQADLLVVRMMIMHNHLKSLPCIQVITNPESIQTYLKNQIKSNHKAIDVFVDVLHDWFLVMPILNELAKCTGWAYLLETKACLLDLDTLYGILINIVYKTPQSDSVLPQIAQVCP